ncbi:DUF305 domain-containing protein [Allosalinactinospora lopnorensis]|uniref:DUF305 domain-containing protein n=1 Tax=Allosalinactinospora lopnorensis TaxID=1352348 RepID=UPI000623F887|nr:DUF305 domain-containing protein [Allosalinactinospora lopnorensis]
MHRWVLAAGAATLVAVSACTGSDSAEGPPVLDPGAPGDSPSPASEERLESAAEDGGHNEADVEYMAKMIEHHKQALEMSELAEDRAEHDGVKGIADRISVAQSSEIEAMEGWLETNVYGPAKENPNHQNYCGLDEEGTSHHDEDCPTDVDHSDMPGMATEAELAELAEVTGAEFDELFVELMVDHHEGGVSMAEDILVDGDSSAIRTMASDVIAEQRAEIARMRGMIED